MIDCGMEAIIIKVAGIGLTSRHLGKTLIDMQPTLIKLVRIFSLGAFIHWKFVEQHVWRTRLR
jgi:diphthamide synthase (EF-2-diphthine--ammonia ligase)